MNISGSVVENNRTIIEENLSLFPSEYDDERHCLLELLRLLAIHPNAQLDRLTVFYALDSKTVHIEETLKYLIDMGVVRMSTENGLTLYSLTEDESLRNSLSMLARRGNDRW